MNIFRVAIFLLIASALSACAISPSEGAIQTAIAETQIAYNQTNIEHTKIPTITNTHTLSPTITYTNTSIPTATATSTATSTPTLTPSHTPTSTPDIRIITGEPDDYILQKGDLPHKYILYPGDSTPHENIEILNVRGTEEGKAYLEATGRVGGWIIWYGLVESTAIAPEWIRSYIVMYDSIEGPQIANTSDWDWVGDNEEPLDIDMDLGDWNQTYTIRERQSGGNIYVYYAIEFIYRNVWAQIWAQGLESDINHEYVESAARAVLEKLINAPMAAP